MPTPTYTPLATITLSGNASSVTFSNISQAYTDLVITSSSNSNALSWLLLRANPITFVHNHINLFSRAGYGNYTTSVTNSEEIVTNIYSEGSTLRRSTITHVLDYSRTDRHKQILMRHSDSQSNYSYQGMAYGHFRTNSAITSLTIVSEGSTFTAGSSFSLFGVKS